MWKSINYSDNMLTEMLEMTVENYGKDNDISKKDFIQHEYFKNPCGKAYIKLAYDQENNVLAGQYIVLPMKIKIIDQQHPVILSLNTLTRENYRGQKIFAALAEETYKECGALGYKFCYGAPNPNSYPGFLKRLSFRNIGTMPLYLKIIHPSLLVKQKLNNSFLSLLAAPFNLVFKPQRTADLKSIISINKDNVNLIDTFWEQIQNKYQIIGVRNSDYLNWRYLCMPEREYQIFAFYEEQKMKGYLVGRKTEVAGMQCGMIVDFLVEKGRNDIASALLTFIQKKYYAEGIGLMGCLMQRHFEEAKSLKKSGFFICPKFMEPQPFPIIYRNLNKLDNIADIDFQNWFFTMGDYDVI